MLVGTTGDLTPSGRSERVADCRWLPRLVDHRSASARLKRLPKLLLDLARGRFRQCQILEWDPGWALPSTRTRIACSMPCLRTKATAWTFASQALRILE